MRRIMSQLKRLPRWVFWWLAISTVVIWDALFVLCRPASFPDGDLGFIWSFAYTIYMAVDLSYADVTNHVIEAMAIRSLLEACIVGIALTLDKRSASHKAHLLALLAAALTCSKTMLFFLVEGMHGWHSIAHNDVGSMLAFYIIPNGIWIVVPMVVVASLSKRLLSALPPGVRET